MFIQHKDLESVEILMSFQRLENGKELPKVIALAQSTKRPYMQSDRSSFEPELAYKTSRSRNGKRTMNYYLVWCNDTNLEKAGYIHLTTKTGRKSSFNSALKYFKNAVKSTEFINFSKI
jgi:hypothetical protein